MTALRCEEIVLVPLLSEEPVGIARLLELAGSQFQAQAAGV